ncbi:hypothetical protein EH206_17815 [Brenneria nigrifluens DSM 30175 = ATCC 13028]|uniref:Amino acid permease/ SLC12A domain-containing protein n=1 Tax=Brenneria nigrifluens DSM 30175 = ATCC 13028 TaxID=1121120 RepID=A0A2U1UC24_9GAMM|nr:hypothetical protein DDT54_22445 [Brenneria nigrifluens DSM 30175 = ATCC 13028]QCR05873.1 hypothetical protein EH206_17815 [Brenneria nigrifluens DSM 30175 = ATCC 13028]
MQSAYARALCRRPGGNRNPAGGGLLSQYQRTKEKRVKPADRGRFIAYTTEFLSEKASYAAGWMDFLDWAIAGIVDISAVALYMHYWEIFAAIGITAGECKNPANGAA